MYRLFKLKVMCVWVSMEVQVAQIKTRTHVHGARAGRSTTAHAILRREASRCIFSLN
jgi:hypothetical protein